MAKPEERDIECSRVMDIITGRPVYRVRYRDLSSRGKWSTFVIVNGEWRGKDLPEIVQRYIEGK